MIAARFAAAFEVVDERLRSIRLAVSQRVQGASLMLLLGAVTGIATGALAALLVSATAAVVVATEGLLRTEGGVRGIGLVLVPAAGAALSWLVIRRTEEVAGSGIVSVMRAIALRGGRFRLRVPFAGVAATSVALGTGSSGGREGPIVLIGGSVGSLLGRLFAVGEQEMRSLVAAGAAAGIGASFNAPIGGMIFAIEFIVGGFRTRSSVQTIVVASVTGAVTARSIVGPELVFRPRQAYALNDPRELVLYGLLGLSAVAVAWLLVESESRARHLLGALAAHLPRVDGLLVRLVAGGAAAGAVALVVPEVLGSGEQLASIDGIRSPLQTLIDGGEGVGLRAVPPLLLLIVAKCVATGASVGSGAAVGTFAPALFVGGALGAAFGAAATDVFPSFGVQPGAFALVGMVAVVAAQARGALTALVLGFELTGTYDMVLPLMLAAGLAAFLADRVLGESIYFQALRREGIVYADSDDVDILQAVAVGEVMTTEPDTIALDADLTALASAFHATGHHGMVVVDGDGRLAGVATRSDLAAAGPGDALVADVCTRRPVTVTPIDPVFRAIRRMASLDVGRLPVVAAHDHGQLVGVLRRPDLVRAYQRAVTRSSGIQRREDRGRLRNLAGVQFVELVVERGAQVDGRLVQEVVWPERTVLTSIRRGGDTLVPRGDTRIEAGDELVALTGTDADQLQGLVGRASGTLVPPSSTSEARA